MGDHSISIVPKKLSYPGKEQKAAAILGWLVAENFVEPELSDCVLGNEGGYAAAQGIKTIQLYPDSEAPLCNAVNGLEIILEKTVFHTGENGMDTMLCPSCNYAFGDLGENKFIGDWIEEWYIKGTEQFKCPGCEQPHLLIDYIMDFDWGFCDLGFTFWNIEGFTDEFINEFSKRLECEVKVIEASI